MMISSILDTDFYKLTMQQVVLHQFPATTVKYKFKCRNTGIKFTKACYDKIMSNIYRLEEVKLSRDEYHYLQHIRFLKSDYIEFLSMFRFIPDRHVHGNFNDGNMGLEISGPWLNTILYEVPVLAIINECYFEALAEQAGCPNCREIGADTVQSKIEAVKKMHCDGFKFADFGTRRRFSFNVQRDVTRALKAQLPNNFVGTSNVYFSERLGLPPLGTMAHEYIQCHQAMGYRLVDSQKMALDNWVKEYRGDLGIALTDTINMNSFLRDFDLYFAKLYDGCRHDSGDPIEWCNKLIKHYSDLHIDPMTKTAVFSDGLTIPKALELYAAFNNRIKMSFGIGTNLTNDVGFTPLQIVMKVIECNGSPVAKLSDNPEKQMCEDPEYVAYIKKVFKS